MAVENGTIFSTIALTVIRDMFPLDPPIDYINPSGLILVDGDSVTMDVDFAGPFPIATILTIVPLAPIERICDYLELNCDYCFTLEKQYSATLNISAGLTPASKPYLWITDKFGNQYSGQVVVAGDGSFNIDTTVFPEGMFNPLAGWFDIFLSSDVDGTSIVPMTFGGSPYNCLKLRTYCYISAWILLTGLWDDLGFWDDNAVWID